jgi:Gpi18-like mannosyltransferase
MNNNMTRTNTLRTLFFVFLFTKLIYLIGPGFVFHGKPFYTADNLCQNDCGWYKKIATQGYTPFNLEEKWPEIKGKVFQSEWAFFPLYPSIIKAIMYVTSWRFEAAALFFSLLISALAFYLFFHFARLWFDSIQRGFYATLLVMLFPFHFYFSAYYTESLFLFLLLLGFFLIYTQSHSLWIVVVASLLPLLRVNGLIAVFFMALYYCERNHLCYLKNITLKKLSPLLMFLPALLSFGAWCGYQYAITGDFFTFNKVQIGWDRKFVYPWMSLFNASNWEIQFLSLYTLTGVLFLFSKFGKMPLSWWLFCLIGILLPLTAGSALSLPRYASILFPLFFALTPAVDRMDNWKKWGLFTLLFSLQLGGYYFYILGHPISF